MEKLDVLVEAKCMSGQKLAFAFVTNSPCSVGGADLRFLSPQPDTSRNRKTTDTGLVHRVVCPFTP